MTLPIFICDDEPLLLSHYRQIVQNWIMINDYDMQVVLATNTAADNRKADIKVGDLTIHPDAYTVTKRGENINLTHREFELLHYLARHLGQVINREHLLQTVWGYDYFGDVRTVDVTVRRLREKIEDNPSHPEWLVTRRGVGYYLANPNQE